MQILPTRFYLSIYELFSPPNIKGSNARRHLSLVVLTQKIFKGLLFCTFFPHCQLNTQVHKTKHYWLSEPVFIVTSGDTLHHFLTRAILEVDNREKVSPGSTNHNWHQEKVLLFDLISKPYKSNGLYLIECLCVITSCNLLECWLYENVNLVLLWISRVLGTRWQWMKVSSEKNNWKINVKRLFFCESDTSL